MSFAKTKHVTTKSAAFTLAEMMIVIAIVAVLTSMVVMALADSANMAKISRTKVQIRKLNNSVLEKWEQFETRSIPIKLPAGGERFPVNSSRIRLYVLRILMRMEMPERFSDVMFVDASAAGNLTPADLDADGNLQTIGDQMSLSAYYRQVDGLGNPLNPIYVPIDTVNASGAAQPFQIPLNTYVNPLNDFFFREVYRAVQIYPTLNGGQPMTWELLLANQGAECLYLIMKSMQDEYGNALDAFADSEIGDFDGDGLLEIHDPWGTPISFLRWAPGLSETGPPSTTSSISPIQSAVASEDPDPFDQMQADPRFWPEDMNGNGTIDAAEITERQENDTFRLVPLIYSAGQDRQYDIWRRDEFDRAAYDTNDRLVNYSYDPPEPVLLSRVPNLHPLFSSNSPYMNDPYWGWGLEADTVPSVGFRLDLDGDGEGYYDNIDNHFGLEN